MTVALYEQGVFTWPEWTAALSDALAAGEPEDAGYYTCWLTALERLLDQKLGTTGTERVALAGAWCRAASATPHGHPIRLENDPDAAANSLTN